MANPLDLAESGPLNLTYPPDGIPRSTPANGSVVTASIVDNAVTTAKIADAQITANKLASDSVTTVKVSDTAITEAKLSTALQTKINKTRLSYQRTLPFFFNDFLVSNNAVLHPFQGIAGSSGTLVSPTAGAVTANHFGVVKLVSSTTTNSGYYIGTSTALILLGGSEYYGLGFNVITLANSTIRFGFLDTTTSADSTDGVYIEIPSTGVLVGKTSTNSSRNSTATTLTVTEGTWYNAFISLNAAATLATFIITNDAGTVLWTDTLATTIPTASGRETGAGIVATNSNTSATDLIHLDYQYVGLDRVLVRGGS